MSSSKREWDLKLLESKRDWIQDELDTLEERETAFLAEIALLDAKIEKHRDTDIMIKSRHRTAVEDYASSSKTPTRIVSPPGVIGDPPHILPEPDVGVFYHGKWGNLERWVKEWDSKHPTGEVKGENDPHGTKAHEPGAKLDAGKPLAGLVLGDFSRALQGVVDVGTFGAKKYTPHGWLEVPDGENRYKDALWRHLLELEETPVDSDSGLPALAHFCWDALAWFELVLRRQEQEQETEAEAAREGADANAGC